ncbi:TlpA family protein disulfide reductase [Glycomyces xiaoerkulensis]|uniref:TlpA family protein disulfide reductase n=1 Tax=Glycomyces xiaoerkulensis TaxID=2038139 RepID=UPI001300040B|nr:redoxin domain-containing protein [Glycomyces xiaoerkulensis]
MRRTAIGISAAGLAAAFALSACGSDRAPAEDESTEPEPTASETGGEETTEAPAEEDAAVPELLDFTAATVDGDDFSGAELAGDPTVLWFWEHDCPICQGQGGTVSGLHGEYGDAVDVVGVSGAGLYAASSDADRRDFVDRTGTADLVHLEDEDYRIRNSFGVVTQSTFVVLDAEGGIVESGSLGEDELHEAVGGLL